MTQPENVTAADPYEGNTEPDPNVDQDVYPVLAPGQIRDAFGNIRRATEDEIGNVGFGATITSEATPTTSTAKATTSTK